ncbi:hypothetical protein RB195_014114 [Necator americanus]|uniref:Uncharacterized protein n=1 Tax=Necator americanus TaxID=51031 RepID=A0ABR1DYM9_NECAM
MLWILVHMELIVLNVALFVAALFCSSHGRDHTVSQEENGVNNAQSLSHRSKGVICLERYSLHYYYSSRRSISKELEFLKASLHESEVVQISDSGVTPLNLSLSIHFKTFEDASTDSHGTAESKSSTKSMDANRPLRAEQSDSNVFNNKKVTKQNKSLEGPHVEIMKNALKKSQISQTTQISLEDAPPKTISVAKPMNTERSGYKHATKKEELLRTAVLKKTSGIDGFKDDEDSDTLKNVESIENEPAAGVVKQNP